MEKGVVKEAVRFRASTDSLHNLGPGLSLSLSFSLSLSLSFSMPDRNGQRGFVSHAHLQQWFNIDMTWQRLTLEVFHPLDPQLAVLLCSILFPLFLSSSFYVSP